MSVPNPATTDWVPLFAGSGGLSYDGDWSSAVTYYDGQVVVKDGIAYLCVGGPTAVAPDPAPWGAAALAKTGYATSLPSSPADGQEHILVDSLTAPTYQWRFRYNAARATNKWEFVGGSPAFNEVAASETLAATASYLALATAGPSIALPVAGDYIVRLGARVGAASAASAAFMSYDIGGTGAVDADGLEATIISSGNWAGALMYERRKSGLAAVTLTAKYKVPSATSTWGKRWMEVVPVAVGG